MQISSFFKPINITLAPAASLPVQGAAFHKQFVKSERTKKITR
jgi:hypothetical protein